MHLNFDIIIDSLSKTYQIRRLGAENRKLLLKRPLLYETGCEFEKDRLYVARSDTLPNTPPKKGISVVCIDQCPPQDWISNGCQILQITNTQSLFSVYNELIKIYDRFDDWELALRNELESDADFDLKNMIKIGVQILNNTISVINSTMMVILYCEINEYIPSEITVRDDHFPMPVEDSEEIKNVCGLERMITVPYISSFAANECRTYCFNLFPYGHFAGCIAITETNHPFTKSELALADYFFVYFEKAFRKYLGSRRLIELPGIVALNHLLNNIPLSRQEQELFSLNNNEQWICFKLQEISNRKFMPNDYMYATLSALMPGSIYSTIYNDSIIGILKSANSEASLSRTMDFFREFLNKMEYIAGLSDEFSDISMIRTYLQQAEYAVEKSTSECIHDADTSYIYYFKDFTLQYMLSHCTGSFNSEHLYSKGLHNLIEHDQRSQTSYLDTLSTYLNNEMNLTATANALFLHRSSLMKRLAKIDCLLGSELEDPQLRLYLRICLSLMKCKPYH